MTSARTSGGSAGRGRRAAPGRGGRSYADWSKDELVARAREIDLKGRSTMTKDQLIRALRRH